MPKVHSLGTQDTIYSRRAWKRNDAIINITDLRLRTYIGFNPEELSKQQDVIINCELQYEANEPCSSDDETTALNYKTITKNDHRACGTGAFSPAGKTDRGSAADPDGKRHGDPGDRES